MEQAGTSGVRMRLRRLLKALPREDLLLLMLGYADGLSDVEIAQVLGRRIATIRRRRGALIADLRTRLRGLQADGEYIYITMWRPVRYGNPTGRWKPCCLQLLTTSKPPCAPRRQRGEEVAYFRVPLDALEYMDLPPAD